MVCFFGCLEKSSTTKPISTIVLEYLKNSKQIEITRGVLLVGF